MPCSTRSATQHCRCDWTFVILLCMVIIVQLLLVFWVKPVFLLVKITAVNWVYLRKHLHSGSVRPCGVFIYITTTLGRWLLGLCVQDVGFMKAEMILFPPPRPQLFIRPLSLSLSFIPCLALSSPLYCPMKAEAQLYSRGAEWTDVAGVEEEAEMSNRSPAAFCKFDSQILKQKENEETYKNKSSLYTMWVIRTTMLPSSSFSSSSSCFTGQLVCFNILFHMLIFVHGKSDIFLWGDETCSLTKSTVKTAFCIFMFYLGMLLLIWLEAFL